MDLTNTIINSDILVAMESIQDKTFDVVITSPPYNLRNTCSPRKNENRRFWGVCSKSKSGLISDGYDGCDDNMDPDVYVSWQRQCLNQMLRVIKDTGAIFYNHKWNIRNGILEDRKPIVSGFPVRQIIIWDRRSGMAFNPTFFLPVYEVIYIIAKKKFKLMPKANLNTDIWHIFYEHKNPHPAAFPLEIPDTILTSCPGNFVLDPFMGSGTVAICAIKNKWNYVGIEQSEKYCKMAEKRIDSFNSQLTMF